MATVQELLRPRVAITGVGMTGGGVYDREGAITICARGVEAGEGCRDDALLPHPLVTTRGAAREGASPNVQRPVADWAFAVTIGGAAWCGHGGGTYEPAGDADMDPLGDGTYEPHGDGT